MMRAAVLLLAFALAGCGSNESDAGGKAGKQARSAQAAAGSGFGADDGKITPNADRIATLGVLNKRNNLTEDLVMKVGETRREGNVRVKLESCERTAPWETPEEEGAFVQVYVNEQASPEGSERWRKVFSGWLFRNSPSLNVVEHPIYDVWVKHCAMKYPGESAKPAPAASATSAPNASGSATGAAPPT